MPIPIPMVRSLSVRAKLMLLYLVVTFAGLVLFGLISFGALQYALLQGKKTHLQGREDRLIALLNDNHKMDVTLPLDEQLRNYALVTHEGNLFRMLNADGTPVYPRDTPSSDPLAASSASKSCIDPCLQYGSVRAPTGAGAVPHDPAEWQTCAAVPGWFHGRAA